MQKFFDHINSLDQEFIPDVKEAVKDFASVIVLGLIFISILVAICLY